MKKAIVLLIFELLFLVAAPLITIFSFYPTFVQSQQLTVNRINIGAIVVVILLWIVLKKTILTKRVAKVTAMSTQMEADLKVEPQGLRRDNLVRELKSLRTESSIMAAVLPLLLFILAIVISFGLVQVVTSIQAQANNFFKSLKDELSKYALCIFAITLEYTIGTVFGVLHDRAKVR